MLLPDQGRRGVEGAIAPNFFEILDCSDILRLRPKIFGLLLLVKIKASNFIGNSLNLDPLL